MVIARPVLLHAHAFNDSRSYIVVTRLHVYIYIRALLPPLLLLLHCFLNVLLALDGLLFAHRASTGHDDPFQVPCSLLLCVIWCSSSHSCAYVIHHARPVLFPISHFRLHRSLCLCAHTPLYAVVCMVTCLVTVLVRTAPTLSPRMKPLIATGKSFFHYVVLPPSVAWLAWGRAHAWPCVSVPGRLGAWDTYACVLHAFASMASVGSRVQ